MVFLYFLIGPRCFSKNTMLGKYLESLGKQIGNAVLNCSSNINSASYLSLFNGYCIILINLCRARLPIILCTVVFIFVSSKKTI